MTNVTPFPPSGGGSGNSTLDLRVSRLEEDMREVKASLKSIDARLASIDLTLARMDGRFAGIEGRIAGIEGRLQMVPTVWQTVSILAVLLFGVAGVIFAAGNFLQP
jgi:hypothetical protein